MIVAGPVGAHEAITRNLGHAMSNYARSTEHGEVTEADGLLLVNSGVRYAVFNAAVLTASFRGDAAAVEECVHTAARHFRARRQPWSCWVCEDLLQPDVREQSRRQFERLGLQLVAEHVGMTADLVQPPLRALPAMDARRVAGPESRRDFVRLASTVFHLPPRVARQVYDSERFWNGNLVGWVGYVDGTPVSTAATDIHAGVIGVYSVATSSEHRRRGYGEWITRHALEAARQTSGLTRSILQSTTAGLSLYRRMGYRPATRFGVYISGG
jgi:ribosomal protein S18 acetylase RimI-like enzyme